MVAKTSSPESLGSEVVTKGSSGSCCGFHQGQADVRTGTPPSEEEAVDQLVETAVVRAVLGGNELTRRNFVKLVGASTLMAALNEVFPLEAAKSWAKEPAGSLEQTDLVIAFLPITCATPLILADRLGLFRKHGLVDSRLAKLPSWPRLTTWAVDNKAHCAHMLSPMPLAITVDALGSGSKGKPFVLPAMQNVNGSAITLHKKHRGATDPQQMKGFTFGVPWYHSMHNFLLRYYLAEGGVHPDRDVKIIPVPPPKMPVQLKNDALDGYLVADPFNQLAVHQGSGFIFKLSGEMWPGHPCCGFSMSRDFATQRPNSFKAAVKAMVEASLFARKPENRGQIPSILAEPEYLNQPVEVLEAVITGTFEDGLGNKRQVPDRIDFDPFPWQSTAVWILTQMKRWGYIKGDVDYKAIAGKVFLAAECGKILSELGVEEAPRAFERPVIMGKEFNPDQAEQYLDAFAIRTAPEGVDATFQDH